MAGRPLRRARLAAQNPLVGWVNESKYAIRDAVEPYAPLLKKGAKEDFEQVYRNVGLPLVVFLEDNTYLMSDPAESPETRVQRASLKKKKWAEYEDLALEKNAIVLLLSPERKSSRSFYKSPSQARGWTQRLTPYTPFNILHRLADESWKSYRGRTPKLELMRRKLNSAQRRWGRTVRGVNTAAGRMGVLGPGEELSDLFAKYALTGKIDFHPPPTQDADEARYNEVLLGTLPFIFPDFIQFLRDSAPIVQVVDLSPSKFLEYAEA